MLKKEQDATKDDLEHSFASVKMQEEWLRSIAAAALVTLIVIAFGLVAGVLLGNL